MPLPGQVLYRVFDGKMEVARFVEESLAEPGCSVTTYVLRKRDGRIRCSKTMYLESPKAAWELYLAEITQALPCILHRIEDAKADLEFAEAEGARVRQILSTI